MTYKVVTCGFKENGGISRSINECKDVVKTDSFKHLNEMIEEYKIRPVNCDRIVLISTCLSNIIEDSAEIKEFYTTRLAEKGISLVVMSKDQEFAKTFNEMFLEEDDIICCWFDNLTVLTLEEMLTGDMSTINNKYKRIDASNNLANVDNTDEDSSSSDNMFKTIEFEENMSIQKDVNFENETLDEEYKAQFNIDEPTIDENVSLALSLDLGDELFNEQEIADEQNNTEDSNIKSASPIKETDNVTKTAEDLDEDIKSFFTDIDVESTKENSDEQSNVVFEQKVEVDEVVQNDEIEHVEKPEETKFEEISHEESKKMTKVNQNQEHNADTVSNETCENESTSGRKKNKKISLNSNKNKKTNIIEKNDDKLEGAKIYRLFPPENEEEQDKNKSGLHIVSDISGESDETEQESDKQKETTDVSVGSLKDLKKLVSKTQTLIGKRVFVVTGREGAGVSTIAMALSYVCNAVMNAKVLYVDMDFRGNDTWLRLSTFNRFNDLNEQGICGLERSKLKDCRVNVISGLDLITSIDTVNYEKIDLNIVLNKILGSQEYDCIIFDIPVSILKHIPSMLYYISENVFVVESNTGGALKMAYSLDNLDVDNKDLFLSKIKVVKNKVKTKFNLRKYFEKNVETVVKLEELHYCKNEIPEIKWDYTLDNLLRLEKASLKAIINLFCEVIGV